MADLKTLAGRLFALRGKWLLTINDCPAARALFRACQLQSTQCDNRGANNALHPHRRLHELIIAPKNQPLNPLATPMQTTFPSPP